VWLRWYRVDRATVVNAEAFLATATTRLALNLAQSARRRHEVHAGPWLDEQAVDRDTDPATRTERGEAIAQAVQVLVERLPPAERAAFVLREGFEYPYQQVARTLQIGTANARQLVRRARLRIASGRRSPGHSTVDGRLLRAFAAASHTGELAGLEAALASGLRRAA
jgi:RNA polymerase sigma factor (sigma-70 family)